MLQDKISEYSKEIAAFNPADTSELEAFRLRFLVSKGIIRSLFDEFKTVSPDEKKVVGKVLNELKQAAEARYKAAHESLSSEVAEENPHADLTLPHTDRPDHIWYPAAPRYHPLKKHRPLQ